MGPGGVCQPARRLAGGVVGTSAEGLSGGRSRVFWLVPPTATDPTVEDDDGGEFELHVRGSLAVSEPGVIRRTALVSESGHRLETDFEAGPS